jgi:starch synthase
VPDVLHCHDWQAGMIPVLLEAQYRHLDLYKNISAMFTIHNLKYQGEFPILTFRELFGLGEEYFSSDKLEFFGNASFLKGGLVYSHVLTTVSSIYAEEIQNPFYGERLEGLLRARRGSLHGIVNGIDYEEYNPETDRFLYRNYNEENLAAKKENKTALQRELGLPVCEETPIIGLISRLVDQKGLDLIACVLDEIFSEDMQFVVLGTGDQRYEQLFREASFRHPDKISANIRFDNALAHKIYAASDLFLMPSLFEPCGLGQIISLRYGTLPIVRETGGLKDTVLSYNETTGEGNGFSFTNYNAHDMLYTIRRALQFYKDEEIWTKLQGAAMSGDYSWRSSAVKYIDLYRSMRGR